MSYMGCPKCGSRDIVGYMGEWECMNCGYKFSYSMKPTHESPQTPRETSYPLKRTNAHRIALILLIIATLIIGLISGYGIGYTIAPAQTIIETTTITRNETQILESVQVTTLTISQTTSSMITMTMTILTTTIEKVTQIVTYTATPTVSLTTIIPATGEIIIQRMNEPFNIETWEIFIGTVEEASYIRCKDQYYKPKEDMKVVVVNIVFMNNGEKTAHTGELRHFMLVTDKGKNYEDVSIDSLEYLSPSNIDSDIEGQAKDFEHRGLGQEVNPDTYVEEQLLFQLAIDEKPMAIYFEVGTSLRKIVIVLFE